MLRRKINHAMRLLILLHPRSTPLSLKEAGICLGVSKKWLSVIAVALMENGIIVGRRGPGGGYVLTPSAYSLTLGELSEYMGYSSLNYPQKLRQFKIFDL